jgi:hypothetical protein
MHIERALRNYLIEEIFPQISPPPYGDIDVQPLTNGKPVYLFTENTKQLMVVGKSFQHGNIPLDKAWISANREYDNLRLAREKLGMNSDSFEIISPLGEKREFSALLVTRKAKGNLLDHYIARAIYEQRRQKLFQKLGHLAKFLAKLHENSRSDISVSSEMAQEYLDRLLYSLRDRLLNFHNIKAMEKCASSWWNTRKICGGETQVIVHGDATPTNFFLNHHKVIGIDLEKMRYADRCWDLGFIAAELKHHFLWRTGSKWESEPFIGHFLWEYASSSSDIRFFYLITDKLPLYMALGLLRIARNKWLNEEYRKILVEEARLCLKSGQ